MELCCFDNARLGESLIRQEHVDGAVTLHIGSEIEKADGQVEKKLEILLCSQMEILQHSQNLETAHSPESAAYSFLRTS